MYAREDKVPQVYFSLFFFSAVRLPALTVLYFIFPPPVPQLPPLQVREVPGPG